MGSVDDPLTSKLAAFGTTIFAEMSALAVETGDPTTLVLAEIDEAGVAHYHWYIEKTTVPGLELADALKAADPAPDALHVGTLGLAMEPIADSLAALVAQVPESTFVMVDPNCRPTATPDFERYQARMRRVISRADVVKGSDEDFEYLALAPTPPSKPLLRHHDDHFAAPAARPWLISYRTA